MNLLLLTVNYTLVTDAKTKSEVYNVEVSKVYCKSLLVR